jgi:hypothetical protein
MARRIICLSLIVSLASFASVYAETEIGLTGQSGWSDNSYLENPEGWGIFVSQNVSKKVAFRFSYNRLDNNFRYIGYMTFGFPPPGYIEVREFINLEVSTNIYEITFHHLLVEGSRMQLAAGGGLGLADFKLHLLGETTDRKMSVEQDTHLFTASVSATVKQFIWSKLALRLGYQYRNMSTISQSTDSFEPFNGVTYSSFNIALLTRL